MEPMTHMEPMTLNPRMAIFAVAGTVAYLALAVLGWGGLAAFFAHPARVALAVATFAMSGAALFTRGNLSGGVREDRSNRWVLWAFGVVGLAAGYLPAYTDRIGFWTIDGDAVRWLGVVLFIAGGALRLWPVFVNSLGWALAFRSVVGVLLTALTLVPLLARIRAEEALLGSQFGAAYEYYRARTSRLVPGLY
jgi:protein-S-isoprenylcysteine O-methyltransferase Ste14